MAEVTSDAIHYSGQPRDPSALLAQVSLPQAWVKHWVSQPEVPQLHDQQLGWVTRGQLHERSTEVAGRLHRGGLQPGDRVLLSGRNGIPLALAHIACLRLGAVVVPVNGAYQQAELSHIVSDARPAAAIVEHPDWPACIRAVSPDVLVTGLSVDLPVARSADAPVLDASATDDPALIGYTSGTTGAPKGAVWSPGTLLASAEALHIAWRWTPDDRLVLPLPLFHMHGLGVGLHGTLLNGASAILQDGFSVDAVLDAIRLHDATLFFGVPTMHTRLAASDRAGELAALRLLVSGSAPLSAALHQLIEDLTGQRILERYGMTETVMLISNPYDGERRAGTVGFPLPGVQLRVDARPGEPGPVLVKGPNVFSGYLNRPEANADAFADGWFRTGDIGSIDSDGYLTLSGRAKELIISGGFNIYPREVEDAIRAHPGVADVAVTGTPNDEWGESVTAWIVPAAAADSNAPASQPPEVDNLRSFLADRLADFKHPRIVHVVDSLPRNALGKVQKHRLG